MKTHIYFVPMQKMKDSRGSLENRMQKAFSVCSNLVWFFYVYFSLVRPYLHLAQRNVSQLSILEVVTISGELLVFWLNRTEIVPLNTLVIFLS